LLGSAIVVAKLSNSMKICYYSHWRSSIVNIYTQKKVSLSNQSRKKFQDKQSIYTIYYTSNNKHGNHITR
jgi:hypothetical protein